MNPIFLGGAAIGVALMYFLDPNTGRRRRARTRDQVVHAARVVNESARVTARDTVQRRQGAWAEAKRMFAHEEVADDALIGRVRAELGRLVSHPHAIEVASSGGHVTLIGPILSHEVRPLLRAVRRVGGVRAVERPAHGLQRAGQRVVAAGRRAAHRPALRAAAGELVARGAHDRRRHRRGADARRHAGAGRDAHAARRGGRRAARARGHEPRPAQPGRLGERGITVQKTIYVAAPVERVYRFWTDYQNFPRFMHNVREVLQVAENRSHWVVAGPAGVPVQWTAEITRVVPGS
jgi:uncharacterized membrane protein